jgi:hypothetical protein
MKDEKADLFADSETLNRWKNYVSQLLNMYVSDIRQINIHTTEPLVPGPSFLEVRIAIAEQKKYKSTGINPIWQN